MTDFDPVVGAYLCVVIEVFAIVCGKVDFVVSSRINFLFFYFSNRFFTILSNSSSDPNKVLLCVFLSAFPTDPEFLYLLVFSSTSV